MKKSTKYTHLYWIKRKNHTDPFREGYIGVSIHPEQRLSEHVDSKINPHLCRALRKHNVEMVILESFNDRSAAYAKEEYYRPSAKIGWNINKGGDEPPRHHLTNEVRAKISSTHKQRGTVPYCDKTHSRATIEKRRQQMRGRQWFHNPHTLAQRLVKECPEGWAIGRVPVKQPKQRGVDYECNVKHWLVVDPTGNEERVCNLKQWCEARNIPYSRVYNNQMGWYSRKINTKDKR